MKNPKLPSLVSILVLTLLTVVMWISFSIYRALTTKPTPEVPSAISQPLTPTLDKSTLDKIESKIFLNDSQIPDNVTSVSVPTSVTTPIPISTPEATSEATPAASASPSASP